MYFHWKKTPIDTWDELKQTLFSVNAFKNRGKLGQKCDISIYTLSVYMTATALYVIVCISLHISCTILARV